MSPNSTKLIALLTEMRAHAADLEEKVHAAEVAHKTALAMKIKNATAFAGSNEANPFASLETACILTHSDTAAMLEDALDEQRRLHEAIASTETLIAVALKAERDAQRAAAQSEIEAELEDMAQTARDLDTQFAAFVGQIVRMSESEKALHRKCTHTFQSPWSGLQVKPVARSLATYLNGLAGLDSPPQPKPFIEMAVEGASHAIRQAIKNVD